MNSLLQRINANKLKIKTEAKLTNKIISSKKKVELEKSRPTQTETEIIYIKL